MENQLAMHHVWHFEGHCFHVLIQDGRVLVELEKLSSHFPVLIKMNIPPSTYHLVLKKELGLKTEAHETPYHIVMISLDTLKTLVASVYDVDLLRFWDQFYAVYHKFDTSKPVDEQPVKPPMSHQKAAALYMILHYRYGGWDETVNEQLYTLLEDYICFPYSHDEDITKSINIAVQAAVYAPQRKRINDHLRHYFLGEDTN